MNPRSQTCRTVQLSLRNILDGNEIVMQELKTDEILRTKINFANERLRFEMENKGFTLNWGFGEASGENEISLFIDGGYCVKLPWKPVMQKLTNNREVAWKCYEGLVQRFRKSTSLPENYKRVIEEYHNEDIVEKSWSDS
ncbi:integrase catalytic domain-containing protein [Nephila pilipes]|uniref:Integrase catalytic domain-containing protein n=1 Tax=Nephila pilipes TaxID=299642 RepID=A0A8X6MW67_NEPPI|nr:integrase catalytic domain-containing protein [Nephila pilipes]